MRRVLVTSQVAFALMLLIGAGVLLASFERVLTINPGFRAANVLTGTVSLPATRYKDDSAIRTTSQRLLEQLRTVPGVEAVGFTTTLPFSGSYSDSVILAEGYQMQPGESLISPSQVVASEGYFEAMGATLVAGRFFNGDDVEERPRVLVIDNRLARRFWPNGDALGKRMYFPADINNLMAKPKEDQLMTIVGIIEPIRLRGLVDGAAQKTGAYYSSLRQVNPRTLGVAIRTTQAPESVTGGVRREFFSLPWPGTGADGQPRRYFIWGATAAMLRNLYRFLSA
jgi:hypothetical protein